MLIVPAMLDERGGSLTVATTVWLAIMLMVSSKAAKSVENNATVMLCFFILRLFWCFCVELFQSSTWIRYVPIWTYLLL